MFANTVQFSGSLMKRMTDFRARKSSQQCILSMETLPYFFEHQPCPVLRRSLCPRGIASLARAIDARARTARACVSVLRAQCARGVSSSTFYGPRCALPFKQPAMRAHLVRRAGRRPVRRRIPCQRDPACCALQTSGKERPDKFAHAISQRDGVPARTRACWNVRVNAHAGLYMYMPVLIRVVRNVGGNLHDASHSCHFDVVQIYASSQRDGVPARTRACWNVRVNACAGLYKDRPVLIRVVRNVGGNLHDASHSYHFDVVQIHARCILLRRVSLRMCVLVCSSV